MTTVRRWALDDRTPWVLIGLASVIYFLLWGGTTRAMGDSPAYRLAADVITGGWDQLTDRAPGFPLLLWATGSADGESTVLFVVQLAMHALAIGLVLDLARRVGVGPRGRLLLVVLLLAPPVVMKAVYSGSEATTEVLVVAVVWALCRWAEAPSTGWLIAVGTLVGASALVRPTYQLLLVPIGVLVWWRSRPERTLRPLIVLTLPVLVLLVPVIALNQSRFDSPTLSPLLPWHLSGKTALYVEELPRRYEPARSFLIAERDRLLVEDPEHSAATFAFDNREELAELTGREGRDLERYVLEMDLELITHNPFGYLESVTQASARYVQLDAQPAGFGGSSLLGWLMALAHAVVALGVVVVALLLPGLVRARGGIEPRAKFLLVTVTVVTLYTALVSVLLETGSARLRAPTDPLIVLGAVVGVHVIRNRMRPSDGAP